MGVGLWAPAFGVRPLTVFVNKLRVDVIVSSCCWSFTSRFVGWEGV